MKKKLLMFASLLGFLLPNLDYLLQAWRHSPLDSLDWIFYLLCIPAAVLALRGIRPGKCDHWAWLLLLPALFLLAGRSLHNVNAAGVFGGVCFCWSVMWLFGGWNFVCRLLPAFLIAALGTPSLTYQLSQWMMISVSFAKGIKFAMAAVGFLWICCNRRFDWNWKKERVFFLAACLFSALLLASCRYSPTAGGRRSRMAAWAAEPGAPDMLGRFAPLYDRMAAWKLQPHEPGVVSPDCVLLREAASEWLNAVVHVVELCSGRRCGSVEACVREIMANPRFRSGARWKNGIFSLVYFRGKAVSHGFFTAPQLKILETTIGFLAAVERRSAPVGEAFFANPAFLRMLALWERFN